MLPIATPDSIGLDARRLDDAYKLMETWTKGAKRVIPGAAIVVGRHGKIVAPRYFGRQGPEPDAEPIRKDGLFLLASITKPVTYLGAMMLVERGLLNLSDPVIQYLPDFAAHHKDETLVQHLFTHTSGMPDMLENNVELRRSHAPLSRFIQGAIRDTVPLFEAGTKQKYQSMGTLTVAGLIEKLSGLKIRDYLKKAIFQPLKLGSIGLGSIGFDRRRLIRVETPAYQANSDFGWNGRYWQELGAPWGGMFSSIEDFSVICQLMLNEGTYGKTRILAPQTVKMMTTNRLNDYPQLPEETRRTQPWGLGWRMNHVGTSSSWGDTLDRSVFGHTGATGTMAWMDRNRDGFCLIFTTGIRSKAPWRLVRVSNAISSAFL